MDIFGYLLIITCREGLILVHLPWTHTRPGRSPVDYIEVPIHLSFNQRVRNMAEDIH
jgi:hypothetical protein